MIFIPFTAQEISIIIEALEDQSKDLLFQNPEGLEIIKDANGRTLQTLSSALRKMRAYDTTSTG